MPDEEGLNPEVEALLEGETDFTPEEPTPTPPEPNAIDPKTLTYGDLEKLIDGLPPKKDPTFDARAESVLALVAYQRRLTQRRLITHMVSVTKVEKATLTGVLGEIQKRLSAQAMKDNDGNLILDRNREGEARPTTENVAACLRGDPKLEGVIYYDDFAKLVCFSRVPPWTHLYRASLDTRDGDPWRDADDTRLLDYLAQEHRVLGLRQGTVRGAVTAYALEHKVNPLQDYLRGLIWDDIPRLDSGLHTYFGVQPLDSEENDAPTVEKHREYVRRIFRWYMISAVARALSPGCKVDHVLVLEGPQGLKKSEAIKRLYGERWVSDADLGDLHNKESCLILQKHWVHELAEGDIFSRACMRATKAFITKARDDVILKYSNDSSEYPRHNVFIMTINEFGDYLLDPTGARRWWPVTCGVIDIEAIERDREQVLAEAVHAYLQGEKWWPATDEEEALCTLEQQERQEHDAWEDDVAHYLLDKDKTTLTECLKGVTEKPVGNWGKLDTMRMRACLLGLGWKQSPGRAHGRQWVRGPKAAPKDTTRKQAEELARKARQEDAEAAVDRAFPKNSDELTLPRKAN